MASELGGQNVLINTGNLNPNAPVTGAALEQFNAMSNFFNGFYNESLGPGVKTLGGFEQVFVTDTGKTLLAFGEVSASGQVANFGQSGDGVVGTGVNTKVVGGSGDNDILITDNASHLVNLGGGNDALQGIGSGPLTVNAGAGNDAVLGGTGNDVINGGAGNDVLLGGAGNDTINGGAGKDRIEGGAGNDTLKGGAGKDLFVFGSAPTGQDTITDFKKGDVLQISDRNGDGQTSSGDIKSIASDGQGGTLLTLVGGDPANPDTIHLEHVKVDKLTQLPDGTFIIH